MSAAGSMTFSPNQSTQLQVNSGRPVLKKRTTQIFDTALLEKARYKPRNKTTFKSKRIPVDKDGRRPRTMYLPEVAIAIKMHERAQKMVDTARKLEEEKCMVGDVESESVSADSQAQ